MHETIRVLHVVRNLDVGGLEVALVRLIERLEGCGIHQGVCCLEAFGEMASNLPPEVPVWSCSEGRRSRWQRPELQAARIMRKFQPHVIHAENYGPWANAVMAWALAGRSGHVAFTLHGWNQTERMPRRQAFICRQLARATTAVTAVSKEAADAYAEETGIPRRRFDVLTLGVDTEQFHPAQRARSTPGNRNPVVFGCVARLNPIKAHDVLLRAVAQLRDRDGAPGIELRLIGDGPARPMLEALARELAIGERVQFLGTRHDLPDLLRELDVFVLPSHREARPVSVMEAMATGLPTLATRVGSVPELVENGRAGLLVEPGDASALAVAIHRLAADAPLRRQLGQAAREIAAREFSIDQMVRQYADFYRRVARTAPLRWMASATRSHFSSTVNLGDTSCVESLESSTLRD